MNFYRDRINPHHLESVTNDFFAKNSDCIGILRESSGDRNKIIDNKLMLLSWAGPEAHIGNVCHEIAHFIEIDDERCHFPDWGLNSGKWNDRFGCYDGMITDKAIRREIRTFGIQHVIHSNYGIKYNDKDDDEWMDAKELESETFYMATICRFIDGMHHFYPLNRKDHTHKACEAYAFEKIQSLIEDEASKWTIPKIMEAWNYRINILRKKIENGCYAEY